MIVLFRVSFIKGNWKSRKRKEEYLHVVLVIRIISDTLIIHTNYS